MSPLTGPVVSRPSSVWSTVRVTSSRNVSGIWFVPTASWAASSFVALAPIVSRDSIRIRAVLTVVVRSIVTFLALGGGPRDNPYGTYATAFTKPESSLENFGQQPLQRRRLE